MELCKAIVLSFCLYPALLSCGASEEATKRTGASIEELPVTIQLGALRLTNTAVELRCEIKNDTAQDIWVFALRPEEGSLDALRETNVNVFLNAKDQTLAIHRRAKPYTMLYADLLCVPYARLLPGRSRAEVLSFRSPIPMEAASRLGFTQAMEQGIERITRVVFEIGYYAAEDLDSFRADRHSAEKIRHDESGDLIFISGSTESKICQAERATRMRIDGVYIPFKQWLAYEQIEPHPRYPREFDDELARLLRESEGLRRLDCVQETEYARRFLRLDRDLFGEPARRIFGVYTEIVEGTIDPGELTQRLDDIMSKPDRKRLLKELSRRSRIASFPQSPPLTSVQTLQDLFYDSSIGIEEYGYSQRLFSVDQDLFEHAARAIADLYLQVTQGTLAPKDLPARLDKVGSQAYRDRVLKELENKAATAGN